MHFDKNNSDFEAEIDLPPLPVMVEIDIVNAIRRINAGLEEKGLFDEGEHMDWVFTEEPFVGTEDSPDMYVLRGRSVFYGGENDGKEIPVYAIVLPEGDVVLEHIPPDGTSKFFKWVRVE